MNDESFDYFSPTVEQITHPLYRKAFNKHILEARKNSNINFKVLPWTVNDKIKIMDIESELDGVITDIPELFL